MKDKIKQIKFIDKVLLPIFGIKSVTDYETIISYKQIKNDQNIIVKLNKAMNIFKKIFPVRDFNLHKYDNKIKTSLQAFSILKKCLQMCNVMYELVTIKRVVHLRLIEKNILLENYIKNMQNSDIRNSNTKSYTPPLRKGKKVITQEDYLQNIKGTTNYEIFLRSDSPMLQRETGKIRICLTSLGINCPCTSIKLSFKKIDDMMNISLKGKYFIEVDSIKLFEGNFNANTNLLSYGNGSDLQEMGIFPFEKTLNTNFYLQCDFDEPLIEDEEITYFNLTVTRAILKKKFQKMRKLEIEFTINDDKFFICHGLIRKILPPQSVTTHEPKAFFKTEETVRNDLKYCKIISENTKNHKNTIDYEPLECLMCLLDRKADVLYYESVKMVKQKYYLIDDNKLVIRHRFSSSFDAVSNIKIILGVEIKGMSIRSYGKEITYHDYILNDGVYEILDFDLDNHLVLCGPLRSSPVHLEIVIPLKDNDLSYILKKLAKITVECNNIFYKQELRREKIGTREGELFDFGLWKWKNYLSN